MKRYLIVGLLLCAFVVTPVLAQTVDNSQLIAQLKAQIQQLTLQLQILQLQIQIATLNGGGASTDTRFKYDMPISSPTTNDQLSLNNNGLVTWTYPSELAGKLVQVTARLITPAQLSVATLSPNYLPGIVFDRETVIVGTPNAGQGLQAGMPLPVHIPSYEISPGQYNVLLTAYDQSTGILHAGLSGQFVFTTGATQGNTNLLIQPNPTLALNYDTSQGEAGLIATFGVNVTNGSDQTIYLYKQQSPINLVNSTQSGKNGAVVFSAQLWVNEKAGGNAIDSGDSWGIPAHQAMNFNLQESLNPKTMFAGVYRAYLDRLAKKCLSNCSEASAYSVAGPAVYTNSVTIIGEKSPYIAVANAAYIQASDTSRVQVQGERLSQATQMIIGGNGLALTSSDVTKTSDQLVSANFKLNPGNYYAYLASPTGESNRFGFQVSGGLISQPTTCTGLQMVWDTGRRDSYSYQNDSCDGYRRLVGNEISPSCYNQEQCLAVGGGTCVNIAQAKSYCPVTQTQPTTQPTITVLTPSGGESWKPGETHTIQWQVRGLGGANNIAVVNLNNGQSGQYYLIWPCSWGNNIIINGPACNSYSIATDGTYQYSWQIPQSIASGQYNLGVGIYPDYGYTHSGPGNTGNSFTITSSQTQPTVTPLDKANYNQGETITVRGSGFTSSSQVLIDGQWYQTPLRSVSAQSISFVAPATFGGYGGPCAHAFSPYNCANLPPPDGWPSSIGSHKVSVANSNDSISNEVVFTIISGTPTTCSGPYHVGTTDGRCVWSCGAGTTPSNTSNECVCQSGLTQTGFDSSNRRICAVITVTTAKPTITSMSPQSGPEGQKGVGDPFITLSGSGFTQSSKVVIGYSANYYTQTNFPQTNSQAPSYVSTDGTQLQFTLPLSGLLPTSATVSISVSNGGSLVSDPMTFTITPPTTVTTPAPAPTPITTPTPVTTIPLLTSLETVTGSCSSGYTQLGTYKGGDGTSNWKICYQTAVNPSSAITRLQATTDACSTGYTQLGTYKGADNTSNWKLCYRATGSNPTSGITNLQTTTGACPSNYQQLATYLGADGSSPWKVCYATGTSNTTALNSGALSQLASALAALQNLLKNWH